MLFTKMHGAGNDFIIINNLVEKIPEELFPSVAKALCQRRMSIGADGMMIIDKAQGDGDFRMHFFNSDGTIGEMCGNGARCIARYGFEKGLSGAVQKIETTAGMVTGWRVDKRQYKVKLNDPTYIQLDHDIEIGGSSYKCSYIELGNPGLPHAVVYLEGMSDMDQDELRQLGRVLRNHSSFPKGANINFCQLDGQDGLKAITFERGVEDFTLACGTGAGSIALAVRLKGIIKEDRVRIEKPGGTLFIELEKRDDSYSIYLTGPTCMVAEGQVLDEDMRELWEGLE
ncbi:MAG TPA: diaminopimelate epimerase [Gudongella oleilytica]|jgi:diaminopimelate epimerase|nr:diaminopimelate epimerase [Gudongella oleilytica]